MFIWVFPSHLVSLNPSGSGSLCLQPLGVGEVANRCILSSHEAEPALPPKLRVEGRNRIMDEDRAQLVRLLRGLKSRYVEPNRLGPPDLEGTVWDMFQYMARMLTPTKARRTRLKRAS